MASITIRNLDPALKAKLRIRAAEHGRSMEQEAREILNQAFEPPVEEEHFVDRIRRRVAELGGIEFEVPPRQDVAEPRVDFSGPEWGEYDK